MKTFYETLILLTVGGLIDIVKIIVRKNRARKRRKKVADQLKDFDAVK